MTKISLAISTCPNDTFAFHALLNKCVDTRGLEFDVQLLDIQQLNDGLFRGEFDVAKASFHAAVLLADDTVVLPSGSALGFGVGPLLLASHKNTSPNRPFIEKAGDFGTTLCPGAHTTATLLFRMFYGNHPNVEHVLFSDIMPTLQDKRADFGVCIHEGRFTWQQQGLHLVEDLGMRWESETQCPLPLGGILARRSLDQHTTQKVHAVIRDSIEYGLRNRNETLATMKRFAQEFDDNVLFQHVDLYVNEWTVELGPVGRQALKTFSDLATQRAIVDCGQSALEVFES